MTEENDRIEIIKHCVYCGAEVDDKKTYCPECGKLVVKLKPTKQKVSQIPSQATPIQAKKADITRKCSGCGSLITSTVLEQCPICNALLEKIPEHLKPSTQTTPGFVFSRKKLVPAEKFILKKESWKLKEGLHIFGNCVLFYITIRLLIFVLLSFLIPEGSPTTSMDIITMLLSQIPEIVFGVYPLWYIYSKNHDFKKLGLLSDSRRVIIAILIGILGGIALLLVNYFSDIFIDFFSVIFIDIFDVEAYIAEQYQVIRSTGLIWIVFLVILLSFGSISLEILFRGVLHNALKEKFGNELNGKIIVIVIVALTYSIAYFFFSFPIGIFFFLLNFLLSLLLGVLYEVNGNLYNTIVANVFYNILVIFAIFYF